MTALKQFTITVPVEYNNRDVFEQVLSDVNNRLTEGQIGDEGTWSGIILNETCNCCITEPESMTEYTTSIIDINCIECREFYKDLGESECICEPLADALPFDIIGKDEGEGCDFCEEWEHQRTDILKDISPEDRIKIMNDLPLSPYEEEDDEDALKFEK